MIVSAGGTGSPGGTGGIEEPVPSSTAAVLRRAALDHARAEHRRGYPALLHVGFPGGAEEVFVLTPGDPADHAIRADVVAALLQRSRARTTAVPLVWLTRPGPLDLQDVDVAWLGAARTAAAEAAVALSMVVVTRRGWLDPRTGVRRTWKRLRQR